MLHQTGPWIIAHGHVLKMRNFATSQIWELNIAIERVPFKLSEYQKIIEIGSPELKL